MAIGRPTDQSFIPAQSLIDWTTTKLLVKPYVDMWSFNPSIHFDGEVWRCAVRCADYAMPGGTQIKGPSADRFGVQSRNVMVHLDPETWRVQEIFPMRELDNLPRNRAENRGYEDIRLFVTDTYGLQGIAASAHLEREAIPGHSKIYPPEQVILTLDEEYHIVEAHPIRGEDWNGPQKNWSPFDGATEPRFLYSIDRGMVFGPHGPVETPEAPASDDDGQLGQGDTQPPAPPPVQARRGTLPVNATEFRRVAAVQAVDAKPLGRRIYGGLRGGTQLLFLGDMGLGADSWLGLGHEMRLERNKKLYWHRFYLCDGNGKMQAKSPAIKLVQEGIEFASGMAIADGQVVISMGVDDAECRLGMTSLDHVLNILEEVTALQPQAPKPRGPTPRRLFSSTQDTSR